MIASTAATQKPTPSSTAGYRQEILSPQSRHRARNRTQLTTGTLSYHRTACPQLLQCDPGRTTDSCPGSREMHTFKKLPRSSPTPNPTTSNHINELTPEVYVRASTPVSAEADRL